MSNKFDFTKYNKKQDNVEEAAGSSHTTLAISSDSIQELVPGGSLESKGISMNALSPAAIAAEKERRRKIRVGMMMAIGLFKH